MSFVDSVLSNTVGLAFRAATGNVDPWTLANEKEQVAADTAQALGPDASDADIAIATAQAQTEVDSYLRSTDAHPDQAGVRLPVLGVVGTPEFLANLEKLVYGLIAVGAVVGGFYFYRQYSTIVKQTFRKK
jgi:hypothetical protein